MLSFADWIDAVRFRWKLTAFVTLVITLLAVVYLLAAPRVYQASSALLVDPRADPLKQGNSEDSQPNNRAMIATQADLIRSPSVTDLAAASAGLTHDPSFMATWRKETDEAIPYADWLRKKMADGLTVIPGKDSNIVVMRAEAKSPTDAARIANGYARAAVEAQYRLRTSPAKNYADWLERRLITAKNSVVESQNTLSSFAKASGIVDDGDVTAEGSQMAQVETQLATAQARAAGSREPSYAGAQGRGDAEKSETVQALRRQVAETSSKLANLQSNFGPDFPEVKSAQAELNSLKGHLNREVAASTNTFNAARSAQAASERDAAAASEAQLSAIASRQRGRVETIGANLAQYQRLKNEFVVAQKNFNEINDRLERMRLQSSIPQTEVQVLDLAAPPLLPSSPRIPITLMLALVLGAILGSLAAIMLEMWDPRVRSWSAVERLLGTPVLGTLTLPPASVERLAMLTSGDA